MNTYADRIQENKSQSVANAVSQKQSGGESVFQFVDNRPETVAQRKLQEMANNSSQVSQLKAEKNVMNQSSVVQLFSKGWTWDGNRWIPDSGSAFPQPSIRGGTVGARLRTDEPETVEDLKIECTDAPLSIGDYNRGREYAAQAFGFAGHPAHASNSVHKHPKSRLQEMHDAGASIAQLREVMRRWGR